MANTQTNLAPLKLVLLITFLGSMGTAVITSGIAFLTDQGLGYTATQNLLLALVLGGVYIPAALLSGPLLRWTAAKAHRLTTRRSLIAIMLLTALIAQAPLLVSRINPGLTELAVWVMGIAYMIASGIQWPIVEAYLSGGRRSTQLRGAIGKFNIVWSSAMVLSYWLMAPLIEEHPFMIISLLGVIHLLIAGLVFMLPSEPAQHFSDDHDLRCPPSTASAKEVFGGTKSLSVQGSLVFQDLLRPRGSKEGTEEEYPPIYVPLLTVFRMMLIASYIILSVMIPLMPSIEKQLGLDELWWTPIASTWLIVRVLFFILFERWHGWHGHWWTPWLGMTAMLTGFAMAIIAPAIGQLIGAHLFGIDYPSIEVNTVGTIVLITGLSLTGVGIAAIYYGALYYAMAVGGSDVDSGGKHEAFIGMGYTAGPLCGLAGGFIYQGGLGVIAVTSAVVLAMVGVAIVKALKHSKP